MTEEEKLKDLKAVYSGAVQSGEIGIANMIKGGIDLLEKKDRTIQQLKDENKTLNRQAQKYFEQGVKKDKMIDLMAKELVKAHEWFYSEFDNYTKEDFIKYFERKVENGN